MNSTNAPHDRYISFCGLECEQRAEVLVTRVCQLARQQEPDNRFWSRFAAKAAAPDGPDALFLVHAYIFYMRDFFAAHQDSDGLSMLDSIETDCC